jgi:hypothetical protein
MSTFSALLCATYTLFSVHNSDGIAIRPFKNVALSTCNSQTALAALGCPCALVGQRCRDFGSRCFGQGNSLIGKGKPKRGICACGNAYPYTSPVTKTCVSRYLTIPSGTAGSCLFRDATITSVNVSVQGQISALDTDFIFFSFTFIST